MVPHHFNSLPKTHTVLIKSNYLKGKGSPCATIPPRMIAGSVAVYFGSEAQVCSSHSHLNMRMMWPLAESSIMPTGCG